MPEGDELLEQIEAGELIATEEGVLTAEDFAAREAAGAGLAPELVTEEELAVQALREQEAAAFDAPVTTFLERGLGAATFGLSDLARSGESAYEARRRQMYNPRAALAGELTGAVAPALLSGGAGFAGTAARLTPMGRLSAATGQWAGRGGLGRAVAGGMIEGVAQAGGDYISRVSLDENAEFSAEALASAMLSGGALGAGAGAIGRGLERALGAGARRLTAPTHKAPTPAAEGLAPLLAAKKPAKWSSYRKVVRRKLADTDAAQARKLGETLESASARPVARELDDITSSTGFQAARAADDEILVLEEAARKAAQEFDEASTAARGWWQRFDDVAGVSTAKAKLTRKADDVLMDEGAETIARLDEARFALDDHLAELRARAGIPTPQPAVTPEALAASSRTLRQRVTDTAGAIRRPAEAVFGAAELARDVGIETGLPTARDVPIIGPIMGAYLRFRGISAAARGLRGRLPMSGATSAAERVVSTESRIRAKVQSLAAGTLKRAVAARAPSITTKAIAQQARDVLDADMPSEAAIAEQDLSDTTSAVQLAASKTMERAIGYLKAHAPRDPMPNRLPGMPEWEPTPTQGREWERRVAAVLDPVDALGTVMTDAGAALELEVLREVHPSHWIEAQSMFREDLEDLQKNLPTAQFQALGRAFGEPTSAAQLPGYRAPAGMPPAPGPMPPSPTAGPSRAAQLEEV